MLENDEIDGIIVGDAGYACKKYLLTPLSNPITVPEKRYNKAHSKTRNVIERLFGAWKRRFHCLSSNMQTKLSTTLTTIVACGVIWNFLKLRNDICAEEINEMEIIESESDQINEYHDVDGFALRYQIINNFFT